MAKKWMSKYSQQLFLLAVAVYYLCSFSRKKRILLNMEKYEKYTGSRQLPDGAGSGHDFVISSGVMDLSAGSIVSLCGVLTALALHGGMGIWASVLTGIAAGGLMGALNGVLIHCTGINFFVLTLASSGMLRGISLMITDGKPITKFGKEFMQLGIGRIGEFQVPVLSPWP
ncbi:MAG: ABC transporter permease [Enterocloster clostridioformis]